MSAKSTTPFSSLLVSGWKLPVISVILVNLMLVIIYSLAVLKDGVEPFLPLVSEAAELPPQAGIFAQFVSVISFLELLTFGIRHQQVKTYLKPSFPVDKLRRLLDLNDRSAMFGILHALLFPAVGNFRLSEYPLTHTFSTALVVMTLTVSIMITIDLTRGLSELGIESRPTTMTINGYLLSAIVCSLTGLLTALRIQWSQSVHGSMNSYLFGHFTKVHNIAAIAELLMFTGMSIFHLCLASRMKKFAHSGFEFSII